MANQRLGHWPTVGGLRPSHCVAHIVSAPRLKKESASWNHDFSWKNPQFDTNWAILSPNLATETASVTLSARVGPGAVSVGQVGSIMDQFWRIGPHLDVATSLSWERALYFCAQGARNERSRAQEREKWRLNVGLWLLIARDSAVNTIFSLFRLTISFYGQSSPSWNEPTRHIGRLQSSIVRPNV